LPALSRAKDKARSVQCANHLKQWQLAMGMYSEDTDFLPREGFQKNGRVRPDEWADVAHADANDVWYNALPPYLDARRAKSYFSRGNGERPKFYEARIFHCPKARFPAGAGMESRAYFSLAMNSKLIQPPVAESATIKMSSIQSPSSTAVFLDARVSLNEVKVDPLQWDIDLGQPSIFASRFAARHYGGGNIAFADGHVSWISGRKVVETSRDDNVDRGFAIFPGSEVIWTPDPLTNPNGPE
jgi:prepilin-type processing-associated H-X9-DG protein